MRYRTPDVFRLGRSALPYSAGNSGPTYSVSVNQRVFTYGPIALLGEPFQAASAARVEVLTAPHLTALSSDDSAWPAPLSLAVTRGIAFAFSSCPYYDVSLQGVPVPGPFPSCFPPSHRSGVAVGHRRVGFPGRRGVTAARSRIRQSPDLRLHAPPRSIS